jgi:F-type H+-transporting ATPase subunit epsilon
MSTAAQADAGPAGDGMIQCLVVTPERTQLDERVEFVALPLYDGELGILPGRAPLIARLGYGALRTRTGTSSNLYFIDGGFVQVRDNVVTVLTNRAIPADRIAAEAVRNELARALAQSATTDGQHQEKERAVARARAQVRIAEFRG